MSIYTIFVSGKLGQGGGGGWTIFSKPKEMSDQTPVWKNILKWPLKWGQGRLIILKYLHHVTYGFNIIRCDNNSNQRQQ